jgi:starch-binding outer membrane protein, SusD/RagB family
MMNHSSFIIHHSSLKIKVKMKKRFFQILAMTALLFAGASCEKNIEIDPESALDASAGFKTKQDVEAALMGCYSNLQSANYTGLRYWLLGDLHADILTHVGTFPSFAQFANKTLFPDNTEIANMWLDMYRGIGRCNTVIASAPAVGTKDPSFNARAAAGEARCLRAFHYFNLLKAFGGSPTGYNQAGGLGVSLITTPTLTTADAQPVKRASEAETWNLILADLDSAIASLPTTVGTGRVNRRVATALKARAQLFRGDWASAETLASSVITTGGYTLMTGANYANQFLSPNLSETIWELQFDATNTNQVAFFYYPTANGGRNEVSTSTALNTAHEANDVRKAVNFTTTAPASKTLKYSKVGGTDNIQMIRLSEMYLIRSEALAQQNKVGAIGELNKIRLRSGLAAATDSTQAGLLTALEKERRIEFAHEGHRWFDLRRYNKTNLVGITQTFRNLWPIPQREKDTSKGVIAQNPGY